ncbi:telomere repeats-binding bouquet formation protein 2 isoform X3 [Harpia harpyja]|uniref:telomere repeats-binding bouquet formation protein 2 isoform X3 n=1 Tax=Harpia harpyja TaxID=202280 RepID=UPI0022B1C0D3|nr:telomere repeats-binding bouquet formation protein 2 isoform X3 [Harpia harpyja]
MTSFTSPCVVGRKAEALGARGGANNSRYTSEYRHPLRKAKPRKRVPTHPVPALLPELQLCGNAFAICSLFIQQITARIHESLDYLESRATVFHSRYLSAWASTDVGAKLSVVLGHFVLPPACLQEEIRRKIGSFIWEQADDSLAEQPNEKLTDEPEAVRKGCEEEAEEDVLDLAESEEETGSRAPAQGEFPYRALQEYPANNMVTAYPSARDMKKYVGELCDFIPGTSGYAVYWIQNEINIYSDVKTKMKRKFK